MPEWVQVGLIFLGFTCAVMIIRLLDGIRDYLWQIRNLQEASHEMLKQISRATTG